MTIDDDTLILYLYDDGLTIEERLRVEHALRVDPAIANRYGDLAGELAALHIESEAMQPSPAAIHRWQTGLARAARIEATATTISRPWRGWLVGAVTAVALLAVVVSMRPIEPRPDAIPFVLSPSRTDHTNENEDTSSSLRRGVQVHLATITRQLDQLPAMDATRQVEIIASLLERNRAYLHAADDQNADHLARVLRAFEPGLRSLATRDSDSPTFRAERERLTFELGIVHARLARPSQA